MECIELKKMIFYARHGVMEQERIVGNKYRIDLKLFLDLSKAVESDKIEDTVNYADIFGTVKEEMAIPSYLLEHIAGRIIRKIKQKYPTIQKIKIRLAKLNPPIEGEIREAAVIITE
ncbi:MAG: dihydroneopterin aldolase [Candidatus Azobacteroides sp.]|nr:dihydroneopterin aldolase [Candidatus Azobacteroides sp.]